MEAITSPSSHRGVHAVAITGVYECLVCKLCFRGGFNVDAIDKLPAVVKSEMFQV